MQLAYDLHIHSSLSPCCDDDSTPSNIVGMAVLKQLDVIAVCDHNSCKNLPEVFRCAEEYGLLVVPGMELTTAEEVHCLCFFETLENALKFSDYVKETLFMPNDVDIFGHQYIVKNDTVTGEEDMMLSSASGIPFDTIYDIITPLGGVMVPAHVERKSHGILAQMGFVPEDSRFKTFEIKHVGFLDDVRKDSYLKDLKHITSSDAHHIGLINERINFIDVPEKSIKSILQYLKN
ncbi:MAG: PHP domain-containing protein [Oscillospiraceae bacterium]|jgi:PHP family Zn ribbon phosphoesterase|nr:PHP domain-containing protein [Oscillospiraceae bacterium]